ncbi:hypothetical protein MCERE10_03116 [Burkholderiaceae bacterium]|jgi:hypothetical protein
MEIRLTKLEAVIPTLATKEDLQRDMNAQTWTIIRWITGVLIAATTATTATTYLITTVAK